MTTETQYAPINNSAARAIPGDVLTKFTTADLLQGFLPNYPIAIVEACEAAALTGGAICLSPLHTHHVLVSIPHLNVELHLPFRIQPVTVNDTIMLAMLLNDLREMHGRVNAWREQQLAAAQAATDQPTPQEDVATN